MQNNIILYQNSENKISLKVTLENETVWLTQEQIALLYNKGRSTVAEHISFIFKEKELEEISVCRKIRQTASDGKEYNVKHYNLDVIIGVGYRVKSTEGTQFRKWATERLKEYIIKGFTIDDDRLKLEGGKNRYFDELLQRIRDIRSSERNFYQKITDIYTTSIDYKKEIKHTLQFFATVQNKMHFAVHGNTASELINKRANADEPLMGLTNFKGEYLTLKDTEIAKNYLTEKELYQLNLIVNLYLDFAELQASNGRLMKMQDWIQKLDDFLNLSEKNILHHNGKITNENAKLKANGEFDKWRKNEDSKYISDFDLTTKKIIKQSKK